jgi:hypothetical protein
MVCCPPLANRVADLMFENVGGKIHSHQDSIRNLTVELPQEYFTKLQAALTTTESDDVSVQSVKKQLRYIEPDGPVSSQCSSHAQREDLPVRDSPKLGRVDNSECHANL